jgi:hypothetical protein
MVRVWANREPREGCGATPGQAGQGPRLEQGASPNCLMATEATHA